MLRFTHPYAWVLLVVLCALGALGIALSWSWRRLTWPQIRRQRKEWMRATAWIESSTRLTAKGDFMLTLRVRFPPASMGYRSSAPESRFRGVSRLPDAMGSNMESAKEVPVLYDPRAPEHIVFDFDAIIGADGAAFARTAYLESGVPKWKRVDATSEAGRSPLHVGDDGPHGEHD